MAKGQGRAQQIEAALLGLAPGVPAFEREEAVAHAMNSAGLRHASPEAAAWLSLVSLVRHLYTDYDQLLADGWGVEAARHATLGPIDAVLAGWGVRRRLSSQGTPSQKGIDS